MIGYKILFVFNLVVSCVSLFALLKALNFNTKNTIKVSNFVLIICCFGTILFDLALYGSFEQLSYFVLFSLAQLLCLYISLCCLKQKVVFYDEHFTVYGFFKKASYKYSEIEKYYIKNNFLTLIIDNKRIKISIIYTNKNLFDFYKILKNNSNNYDSF